MMRVHLPVWMALVLFCRVGLEAAPPLVVSCTVEDGQDDVDPALTEIRVQFDQAMGANSWSIVGGGPMFPDLVGKPRWVDSKTIAIGVRLKPEHEYWMSINSETFQGFRSRDREAAIPQPLSFKTRAPGPAAEPAEPLSLQQNRDAIAVLRKAIDANYSYRDRLKIDWDKAFAEQSPTMETAKTANQFARAVVKLLRKAQDAHVAVRVGERTIGTHVNASPPNFNVQALRQAVPEWKEHGGVVSGKFAGEIGYLMIGQWDQSASLGLDEAFISLKDTKGLIIDVRMNGGGDEQLAQAFAARFIEETKVYSKNRIRRDGRWSGPFDRSIEPAAETERYRRPVAVLIGPKVASSCESFVLMMKQDPRCKLVGTTTKGSSGNPQPFDLGNGVTVLLSSWEDQLPDGTPLEGHGVKPDITVKTTVAGLRQADIVLEAALAAVRK